MADYTPLVTVEDTIDAPPARVWEVATQQTGVMFMGADVQTDWQVGHAITFAGEWKGKRYEDRGTVQAVDRESRLAFTHYSALSGQPDTPEHYNLVALALAPRGDGTHVTLTQSIAAAATPPDAKTIAEYEKNWTTMLGNLKRAAEEE